MLKRGKDIDKATKQSLNLSRHVTQDVTKDSVHGAVKNREGSYQTWNQGAESWVDVEVRPVVDLQALYEDCPPF